MQWKLQFISIIQDRIEAKRLTLLMNFCKQLSVIDLIEMKYRMGLEQYVHNIFIAVCLYRILWKNQTSFKLLMHALFCMRLIKDSSFLSGFLLKLESRRAFIHSLKIELKNFSIAKRKRKYIEDHDNNFVLILLKFYFQLYLYQFICILTVWQKFHTKVVS